MRINITVEEIKFPEAIEEKYEVGFTAPHSRYVEWGTRPHYPPPSAIEGWVKRKLGLSGKEAIKATNAICWWIYHHGTNAHPFFRPAIDEAMARFDELYAHKAKLRNVAQFIIERAQQIINDEGITDRGLLARSGYVEEK